MRACCIRTHGGPDVVTVLELPEPAAPGPGEVLVRVRAAALNHLDLWVRAGRGDLPPGGLVLGSEGAGVVEAVGAGVAAWAAGDEVVLHPGLSCGACEWCRRGEQSECERFGLLGVARGGTYAERVVVPARNVLPKPPHLSFPEAAALVLDHTTAWRMLARRAALGAGETLLIHGIGGGAALAALQLGRLLGARCLVTSSSDEKLARAAALGAEAGWNYRATDVAAAARALTKGRGVDVAFDSVGAATLALDVAALRRGGRAVFCGVTSGASAALDLRALYWNHLTLLGSTLGSDEDARRMLDAVGAARLVPVIDSVHPLADARAALERLERGEQFGKIVLSLD